MSLDRPLSHEDARNIARRGRHELATARRVGQPKRAWLAGSAYGRASVAQDYGPYTYGQIGDPAQVRREAALMAIRRDIRRNSGETLRDLERAWRTDGTRLSRIAYLRELKRRGEARPTDLRILNHLEHEEKLFEGHRHHEERVLEIEGLGEGYVEHESAAQTGSDRTALERALQSLNLRIWTEGRDGNRRRVWIVSGDQRSRFDKSLGHRVAGTPWQREAGYVSRSTGGAWILLPNTRSTGGGLIHSDSILEIRDTKTGRVYWSHGSYNPDLWSWESKTNFKHEPWSEYAVERLVWLANGLGVQVGDLSREVLELGSFNSLREAISTMTNNNGEEYTRQRIEEAARTKHGNPGY